MARGAEEVVDDPTFTLYSPDEAPGDDCLPGKVFTLCTYTNKIENFKLYARDIWTHVECMSKIGHSRQNCTLFMRTKLEKNIMDKHKLNSIG